ncbi:MAG: glycoside hydrolase family 38 C-terminal domain-containing protein, partial [Oscillospiraceae bacterium]
MFFELERQQRILDDLKQLIYPHKIAIKEYQIKDGKELHEGNWIDFCTDQVWTGKDRHRWFQTNLIIPVEFDGKKVEYHISTGREGEWDATNPQALLYINGKIAQGIDVNHTCVTLSSCAKAGEAYDIRFLMYSGTDKDDLILKTELLVLDTITEKLYYDLLIPIDSAKVLSASNDNARKILLMSSKAVDVIDLRKPYSKFYYESVEKAMILLKEAFYTDIDKTAPVVSAIGHTHIDIAWLWTVSETREKALRSFATVLRLMEEYPDYTFMSSQPILYQFVKEQEPEMYGKIKERIKEGRWEVDGAMWLEADCNLPSGESLVRQIIKGEKFFADEFGIKSKSLWLPDVFGYSAALPQILKKSGIEYFMTTKICWNQFNILPNDTFMWKGLDGTEIFTYMPTTTDYNRNLGLNISFTDKKNTTTYTGNINANMTLGTYNRFQNKDLQENTLMLYGFGDGGGGPTKEMLEQSKRLAYGLPGIPRIVKEREGDFFDRTYANLKEHTHMPKWSGELYFEYHRGTYTSMAKNKWYNRKNELIYRDLECLSSALLPKGYGYPIQTIEKGWDVLLLNQFHDIIPGTSIEAVYKVTDMEYEEILSNAKISIDQKMDQLVDTIAYGKNVFMVYNSLGYVRDDIVTLSVSKDKIVSCVQDFAGNTYPVQYTDDTTIIFFAKFIPSMGYKLFELVYGQPIEYIKNELSSVYENEFYRVCFDEAYQITSLIEKQTQKEFIAKGKKGNQLLAYEDRPINWDNWDIDIFHKRKQYQMDAVEPAQLIEDGPVRTCIKVTHIFIDSTITQSIYLYKNIPRIDFYNKVDWQQHNVLLKVGFPVE